MPLATPASHDGGIRKLAIAGFVVLVALVTNFYLGDPGQRLQTDWTAFDNAATRLFAGETVYQPWDFEAEPLPYLYPPFALWLAVPLQPFGFFGSWAISFTMTAVTSLFGVRFLAAATAKGVRQTTGVIVAGTTGSFFGAAALGQYSGFYVLSLGLALWLWKKDRLFLSGLALGILWMKPNFAIAIPVVLVWSRSWPVLRGFMTSMVVAFVASIPFGLQIWAEAYDNIRDMGERQVAGQLFESKFVSVLGAFQAVTGKQLLDASSIAVFLVVAFIVGVATLIVWHPSRLQGNLDRAFGVLAVFVVVTNTRVYFYDGAVAIFGVLALWLYAQRTGDRSSARWMAALALPLWIASWGNVFESLNAFFGVIAAVIAVVVSVNALRRPVDHSPGLESGHVESTAAVHL